MTRIACLTILAAITFTAAAPAQNFLGKTMQVWLADLDRGNDAARRSAAFALGKVGTAEALASLKKHLREDKDHRVREASAFALGEIAKRSLQAAQDAKLVNVLSEALANDKDPLVRRSAAFALGCLESDALAALPALTKALADNAKSPEVKQNVAWALAKLGKPAVEALKRALHDADPLVKRDAARAMEPMPPEAIRLALPDLANLCKDNDSEVRRAALGTLIKNVTPEDVKEAGMIQSALSDKDEEVKNFAALTLANIGGKAAQAAVPRLLAGVKQRTDLDLRRQCAAGIRNVGPSAKAAVPDLIKLLRDDDAEVRANAAMALGGIAEEAGAAFAPLLQLLEKADENPKTRVEAAHALKCIGKAPGAKAAVPRLLKIVGNPAEQTDVRQRTMWAIRIHYEDLPQMKEVYPTFYKVLAEPKDVANRMLRYDCAYMLGMLQTQAVEPLVMATLHDFLLDTDITIFDKKDTKVKGTGVEFNGGDGGTKESSKGDGRVMAVQALGAIGVRRVQADPGVMTELRKLAASRETNPDLKEMCTELLKKIGR